MEFYYFKTLYYVKKFPSPTYHKQCAAKSSIKYRCSIAIAQEVGKILKTIVRFSFRYLLRETLWGII